MGGPTQICDERLGSISGSHEGLISGGPRLEFAFWLGHVQSGSDTLGPLASLYWLRTHPRLASTLLDSLSNIYP